MAIKDVGTARVSLVSGASRGIGREVALQLLALGDVVYLGMRGDAAGIGDVRCEFGDRARAVQLDITNAADVRNAAGSIKARHGRLDALVNNAAVGYDSENRGVDVDLDFVRREFETNLFGAWSMIQAMLPLIRRSDHGRIVNVSSEGGSLASMDGGTPAYSTSKAALNALTRIIADEVRTDGILVNAVCPGWTATDMGGGGRPVPEGAASVVWGVTLADGGPTGGFFRDGKALPW